MTEQTTARKSTLPPASLSLDLDNLWSYLKVHGEPEWVNYPSYLRTAIPIILEFLQSHQQTITFFVVGRDALREENAEPLAQIIRSGHEIGNHSMSHESWMHTYSEEQILEEIGGTDRAILEVTGFQPQGFRGPGFSYSPTMLHVLSKLGYSFDASLLPSILGPVARLYYMWGSKMTREERKSRNNLFGRLSDGFFPLRPFEWTTPDGLILEIPVTTVPLVRFPFHLSYIMWLSKFSYSAAIAYFTTAIKLCRLRGVEPSFLLHPLDFLGKGDIKGLEFFPGMELTREHKLRVAHEVLRIYRKHYEVLPMGEHARRIRQDHRLRSVVPVSIEEHAGAR